MKMKKPNNPKCDTCAVIRNVLRCWCCKYKTKEWMAENMMYAMLIGEGDCYKPKGEKEEI